MPIFQMNADYNQAEIREALRVLEGVPGAEAEVRRQVCRSALAAFGFSLLTDCVDGLEFVDEIPGATEVFNLWVEHSCLHQFLDPEAVPDEIILTDSENDPVLCYFYRGDYGAIVCSHNLRVHKATCWATQDLGNGQDMVAWLLAMVGGSKRTMDGVTFRGTPVYVHPEMVYGTLDRRVRGWLDENGLLSDGMLKGDLKSIAKLYGLANPHWYVPGT